MKQSLSFQATILMASFIIAGSIGYAAYKKPDDRRVDKTILSSKNQKVDDIDAEEILPENGVVLPAVWGDLGLRVTSVGVIDKAKFEEIYSSRGGLSEVERRLIEGSDNGNLVINSENSGLLLNLLWALGLGNKNIILENGPMTDSKYGGAGGFASTGGWTLSASDSMDHYSRHRFIVLTEEQQAMVERAAKNIYRPCCNNSTYFPDCNHGMAMLGLLELMASQGVSEEEMYKAALAVNSFWFPDTYLTIAKHMKSKGIDWKNVNAREVLGLNYSSGSGYAQLVERMKNTGGTDRRSGGGGCSV
ncbi:hypothetical protein C4572_01525 [Candidatus Parcubacteria bacterium]|nr:MAG: hypothetical protein C4572_01525 [Candidatus Parcubacteria bacterium]